MQRGQEKKDLQSLQTIIGLQQPSEVDTGTGLRSQVNFDPALQTVKGAGAPQRGLFDFAKIGQTPPIYSGPQEQQQPSIGLMQPQQATGQNALAMPQQPTPQIQAPTITQRERTIKDVEGDIRKNYAARMQDAIKSGNINPTMLRQYMPQIQQQMNSEIEQARGDYKKSQGDAALQDVMNAKGSADQKKALIKYAQTTGNMDMATLRGLLSSNTQKYDDGANIHFYRTDSMGNPVDVDQEGKPVAYFSVAKQVSPELLANQKFQAEQNDLNRAVTTRGQDISLARSSGGGGGGGADSTFTKGENQALTRANATINAFNSRWKDQYTGELKAGHVNDPLYQAYQQAIAIQNQIYGSKQPGQGQSGEQSQADPMTTEIGYIQEARQSGVSDDKIIQSLQSRSAELAAKGIDANALIAQIRPPRRQPQITDYGGLDEINNNWQF